MNAIGTKMGDPINCGLTRWQWKVYYIDYIDAVTESERDPVSKHQIYSLLWRRSGLTQDGTAEPVSRDQILRRERGEGKHIFSFQLTTSMIGNHILLFWGSLGSSEVYL